MSEKYRVWYPFIPFFLILLGMAIVSFSYLNLVSTWFYLFNRNEYRPSVFKVEKSELGGRNGERLYLIGFVEDTRGNAIRVRQECNALVIPYDTKRLLFDGEHIKFDKEVLWSESKVGLFVVKGLDLALLDSSFGKASWFNAILLTVGSTLVLAVGAYLFYREIRRRKNWQPESKKR